MEEIWNLLKIGRESIPIVNNKNVVLVFYGGKIQRGTIFPKTTIDETTLYYHFPGFDDPDSKNSSLNIATAYFTKKILEQRNNVKLLFSIDTGDRTNFINYIENVANMINDVNKFNDSVHLISTNEELLISAKEFLCRGNRIEENNTIQLIDILRKKSKNCDKRTIDECLTFAPTAFGDFKWNLTEESQIRVNEMFRRVEFDVESSVESIASKIWNYYVKQQNAMNDLYKLYEKFNKGMDELATALNAIDDKTTTLRDFIVRLEDLLEPLNVSSLRDDLVKIFVQDQNYQLLRFVSVAELKINLRSLIVPLEEGLKKFNASHVWCGFLLRLYHQLTRYETQNDTDYEKLKQNLTIVKKNSGTGLRSFLQNVCPEFDYLGYDDVENLIIDRDRWTMLDKIFHRAFDRDKSSTCDEATKEFVLEGRYLKLTDIDWNDSCIKNARSIVVFSRKKIYIDADVSFESRDKIVVLSPEWEIIDSRIIDLTNVTFLGVGRTFDEGMNLLIRANEPTNYVKLIELEEKSGIVAENVNLICEDGLFRTNAFARYKKTLLEHANDEMDKNAIDRMLVGLDGNDCVRGSYDPSDFVDEFVNLEDHYREDSIPLYESLLKRVEFHAKNNNASRDDQMILVYAYAATWSKLWSLKNNLNENLIIDVEGYLDNVSNEVQDLSESAKIIAINQINDNHEKKIDTTIKEILNFVDRRLIPELKKINDNAQASIKSLLLEVEEKRAEYKNLAELEESRSANLELLSGLRISCEILTAFGFVAMVFGPIGLAIGAGSAISGTIALSVTDFFETPPIVVPEIPEAVERVSHARDRVRERLIANKRKAFEEQLSLIKEGAKDCPDELSDVERTLFEMNYEDVETRAVQAVLTRALAKLRDSGKGGEKIQKAAELIERTRMIPLILGLVDDSKSWRKENNEAIRGASDYVERLISYEDEINEFLSPMIEDAGNWIDELLLATRKRSGPSLDFTKWSIQSKLKNIKKFMSSFTKGFRMHPSFMEHWDRMGEIVDRLIDAYDGIDAMKNQKRFANYVAALASDDSREDGARLKRAIRYYTVLGQYNRVLGSLKQSVFPFGHFYLERGELTGNATAANGEIVDVLVQKLDDLKRNFMESRTSSISDIDTDLISTEFSGKIGFDDPFYVWRNEEYREAIEKLLRGEEVVLKADIEKAKARNAVKFDKIELLFASRNDAAMQREIETSLMDFSISMTHMGVSRYRCGRKSYKIVSGEQKLYYTYAKDREGEPLRQNQVYQKLKRIKKPVLSPYAMWKFRLRSLRNDNFQSLTKYKDHVDLELSGSGTFVADNAKICYTDLDRYYTFDQDLSQTSKLYDENINRRHRRDANSSLQISNDRGSGIVLGNNYTYSGNDTLLLLQYGARKITGSKLGELNSTEEESRFDDAFVRAANVASRFEKMVKNLCTKYDIPIEKLMFDPVDLIGKVKANMIDGSREKCRGIFYDSVVRGNSELLTDKFKNHLSGLISKLFSCE